MHLRPGNLARAFGIALLAGWLRGGLAIDVSAGPWTLALAGLLVGFGTRLGSGCTSGHGVCGMGRGSRRSFVATVVFVSAGVGTVTLLRHLLGGTA